MVQPACDSSLAAASGMRAINLARRLRPDVIVTDLLLPDVDGVTVTERVPADLTATQVVMLTGVDEGMVQSVVRSMRAQLATC